MAGRSLRGARQPNSCASNALPAAQAMVRHVRAATLERCGHSLAATGALDDHLADHLAGLEQGLLDGQRLGEVEGVAGAMAVQASCSRGVGGAKCQRESEAGSGAAEGAGQAGFPGQRRSGTLKALPCDIRSVRTEQFADRLCSLADGWVHALRASSLRRAMGAVLPSPAMPVWSQSAHREADQPAPGRPWPARRGG